MPTALRIQSILGLPVLAQDGAKAGEVTDVWFGEQWQLAGVVLKARFGYGKTRRTVRWHDVLTYGEDALLIEGRQSVTKIDKNSMPRAFVSGTVRLKDMPVYTVSGLHLGKVTDVYFKAPEGTPLIGFELTDGFLSDLLEGRRRLMLPEGPEPVTIGEHAIMVPESYERVWMRDKREMRKVTGDEG